MLEVGTVYVTEFGSFEVSGWNHGDAPITLDLIVLDDYLPSNEPLTLFTYDNVADLPDFLLEGDTSCLYLEGEYYQVETEVTSTSLNLVFEIDKCLNLGGTVLSGVVMLHFI
jgi:hypothetical protein